MSWQSTAFRLLIKLLHVIAQVRRLLSHGDYETAYHTIVLELSAKGARPSGTADIQDNTSADTLTRDEWATLNDHLLASKDPDDAKYRSIFTYLTSTVSRSDDGRLMYLPNIMAPIAADCIGAPDPGVITSHTSQIQLRSPSAKANRSLLLACIQRPCTCMITLLIVCFAFLTCLRDWQQGCSSALLCLTLAPTTEG